MLRARGVAFLTLNSLLLLHAYNCRHQRLSLFDFPLFNNKVIFLSVLLGTLIAVPILYVPWLNEEVFKHSRLGWGWALVFGLCIVFMLFAEAYKALKRRCLPPPQVKFDDELSDAPASELKSSRPEGQVLFSDVV